MSSSIVQQTWTQTNDEWLREKAKCFYIPTKYTHLEEDTVTVIKRQIADCLEEIEKKLQTDYTNVLTHEELLEYRFRPLPIEWKNRPCISGYRDVQSYLDVLNRSKNILSEVTFNEEVPIDHEFDGMPEEYNSRLINEYLVAITTDDVNPHLENVNQFFTYLLSRGMKVKRGDIIIFEVLLGRRAAGYYIVDEVQGRQSLDFFMDIYTADSGHFEQPERFEAVTQFPPMYFSKFSSAIFFDYRRFLDQMFTNIRDEGDVFITTILYDRIVDSGIYDTSVGHGGTPIEYTIVIAKNEDDRMPSSVNELDSILDERSLDKYHEESDISSKYLKDDPYSTLIYYCMES